MPTWAVTGKLGGGKTLWAVSKSLEYLTSGRVVAANIDIFPDQFSRHYRDNEDIKLLRIPDNPTRRDLDVLGVGNPTTDESRNGLLVLDECGNILNSRTYNDAGRKVLIEWFLHARKLGWDLMFIVQNVSLIDKQIRDALIEYKVTVKRMDRLNLPFLSSLGLKVKLPQIHFAIIRYGTESNASVADRDFFRGRNLFKVYSTRQLLVSSRSEDGGEVKQVEVCHEGVSSSLSPWHLKGRYMSRYHLVKPFVRSAFVFGLLIGVALLFCWGNYQGYVKPSSAESKLDVVRDISGLINEPGGSVLAIYDNGKAERTFTFRQDAAGYALKLSDGKEHRLKGGDK